MSNRAWVTLATNDSYGLGALVLAHSLRRAGSSYPAVVLITPSVTEAMRDRLSAVFAEVVMVDVLDSGDAAHLALLQRPELGITFTKIHCWNLTQYEKCVFLDADTLVVQNCDELFEREELSAAPDVGWPDCFNSGVFVYKPSAETFAALIEFAQQRGSFDGGDQGLLNSYFSDWAHGDINKHLPFLYNVTSAAFYSYLPALKHYGRDLKIIHFIGAAKPWLQQFDWRSRQVQAPEHLRDLLQLWWNLFVAQVHSQLDPSMGSTAESGVAGNLARVTPDAAGESEAIDELTRRQGWEAGNIDYMGADSFDNIWAKISQTLSQASPPKQATPPPEEATPAKEPEQPLPAKEAEPAPAATAEEPVAAKLAAEPQTAAAEQSAAAPTSSEVSSETTDVSVPSEIAPTVADTVVEPKEAASPAEPSPAETVVEAPISKEAEPAAETIPQPVSSEKASVPVETADIPIETSTPVDIPVPVVEAVLAQAAEPVVAAPVAPEEIPAPVLEVSAAVGTPKEAAPTPVTTPEKPEKTKVADAKVTPAKPVATPAVAAEAPPSTGAETAKPEEKPAKPEDVPVATATDSPPLANTPSTEVPADPAAKSEERRRPAGKLQLSPPLAADPLPTPDSELEDAASLAQSIIASELRTPTVTSPSPVSPTPPAHHQEKRLSAPGPQIPTPPVSLTQIGVKPATAKGKATIAAQIESSVADKPAEPKADVPKKKVVKKVLKKESSGEAPVPPPRKKEKKPKEK